MARKHRAFTLVELLVVLAVVTILAGMLFPVIVRLRAASKSTVCLSNYRQAAAATMMYVADYDDHYMPVNHQPATPPNSRNDRTWVQLVLPYVRQFSVFRCPADDSVRPTPEATYDQDLVPGDTFSQFYTASLRVNTAYNYLYLSPVVRFGGRWTAVPRSTYDVAEPSRTLLFVDSVWSRDESGAPVGGGSWLAVPPCRFLEEDGRRIDTFTERTPSTRIFVAGEATGWDVDDEASALLYGGAWPWHAGRMTVALTDGSVRSVAPPQLWEGCDVRGAWTGVIRSVERYTWDLR